MIKQLFEFDDWLQSLINCKKIEEVDTTIVFEERKRILKLVKEGFRKMVYKLQMLPVETLKIPDETFTNLKGIIHDLTQKNDELKSEIRKIK